MLKMAQGHNKHSKYIGTNKLFEIGKEKNNLEVLHPKLVLGRNGDEEGGVQRYKVTLVMCSERKTTCDIGSFSPIVDHTIVKYLLLQPIKKVGM